MLNSYIVTAAADGTALTVLTEGGYIKRDAMLARVRANDESFYEVRAPLTGRIAQAFIREGERVGAGSKLFVLAPESAGVADARWIIRLGECRTRRVDVSAGCGRHAGRHQTTRAQTVEAIKRRTSQKNVNVSQRAAAGGPSVIYACAISH